MSAVVCKTVYLDAEASARLERARGELALFVSGKAQLSPGRFTNAQVQAFDLAIDLLATLAGPIATVTLVAGAERGEPIRSERAAYPDWLVYGPLADTLVCTRCGLELRSVSQAEPVRGVAAFVEKHAACGGESAA